MICGAEFRRAAQIEIWVEAVVDAPGQLAHDVVLHSRFRQIQRIIGGPDTRPRTLLRRQKLVEHRLAGVGWSARHSLARACYGRIERLALLRAEGLHALLRFAPKGAIPGAVLKAELTRIERLLPARARNSHFVAAHFCSALLRDLRRVIPHTTEHLRLNLT